MKRSGKCQKCGGETIIGEAMPYRNQQLRIVTFRDPDASVDKEPVFSTVSIWVCGDCGFTEFYADHPARLKDAHLHAQALREKRKSTG
jgi:predicted nucleic-acid-binding Zn-ribbon protein